MVDEIDQTGSLHPPSKIHMLSYLLSSNHFKNIHGHWRQIYWLLFKVFLMDDVK